MAADWPLTASTMADEPPMVSCRRRCRVSRRRHGHFGHMLCAVKSPRRLMRRYWRLVNSEITYFRGFPSQKSRGRVFSLDRQMEDGQMMKERRLPGGYINNSFIIV